MANHDIWDDLEASLPGETLGEEMFEFISAYADGECTPKERRLVEAYLAENAEGRRLLADLRAQASLAIADAEPPEWLRDAILAKTSRRRRTLWPAITGLSTAGAAAALAIWLAMPHENSQPNTLVAENNSKPPVVSLPAPSVVAENTNQLEPQDTVRKPNNNERLAYHESKAPLEEPSATEQQKPIVTPPAPGKHVTVSYALADTRPTEGPPAPDTVLLVNSGSETEMPPASTENDVKKEEGPVMTDAREKLRDRLKKVNQDNRDIKEAVRSTTS